MSLPTFTTGSGEAPPCCILDGQTAFEKYGAEIRSVNGCPKCRGPISQVLGFNPSDSYYYLSCPICNRTIRFCDINGRSTAKYDVMVSRKTTSLDIDNDFPCYTGTF